MLTTKTRADFTTLMDGLVWRDGSGQAPAIIYFSTTSAPVELSRRMLRQRVQAYAGALRKLGVNPGELLILAHTQNLESIYLFWAAIWVGAIPSMFPTLTEKLDPQVYRRNMGVLVAHSGAKMVLTTHAFVRELQTAVDVPVHSTRQLQATAAGRPPPIVRGDAGEIAFLQHSSGTTGLQKGVALSHESVLNQLAAYADALKLAEKEVIVSWLPLYHDMGLIAGFLLPLIQGIPLVLMSPFDWVRHPALLLQAIDRYRGTLCWLPNFAYNHCARRIRRRDAQGVRLDSMRAFINCSEPVRADSHALFLERFSGQGAHAGQLAVSYAMAENTFAVTQTAVGAPAPVYYFDQQALQERLIAIPVDQDHPRATAHVSCGVPIPGCSIRIVNGAGQQKEKNGVGEIAVRSNSMLSEYYRRQDLHPFTADGWYMTGDRGFIAGDQLFVIGRRKDLIINAGKNIYPQDIEAIINQVPGVRPGRAVVFGVPDAKEGTELLAVAAEMDPDHKVKPQHLKKTIRQEVARQSSVHLSYVELVPRKWLLKTSSGKLARAANRDKWLAQKGMIAV